MDISRDRRNGQLWLIQHEYIQKVLRKFKMHEATEVSVPLAQYFKLSEKDKKCRGFLMILMQFRV